MLFFVIIVGLVITYILIGLFKTIFYKNREIRRIELNNKYYNRSLQYGDELFELIKVSTPPATNSDVKFSYN